MRASEARAAPALLDWQALVQVISAVAPVSPESITPDARIVEDLLCDSVALAELVVVLIDDYGVVDIVERVEPRGWAELTAGELLAECLS